MHNGCSTGWKSSNGAIRSRKCNATGSAGRKERRCIFSLAEKSAVEVAVSESWNQEPGTMEPRNLEPGMNIEVFTTRPDTLFGATFMVLAPEHELVPQITTPDRKEKVNDYIEWAKNRSERDRMTEVKRITGEFTGAYGINPLTGQEIPIWVADYVLAGYGTGAIMAVPAHDSRDFAFARYFDLPIIQVVSKEDEEESDTQTMVRIL